MRVKLKLAAKHIIVFALLVWGPLTLTGVQAGGLNQHLNLVPLPSLVEQQPGAGTFILDAHTVVVADDMFTNEAAWLVEKLQLRNQGLNAPTNSLIQLTTQDAVGLDDEAYRLEVNRQGIIIHARTAAGAFYGCQTLRQLAAQGTNPIPFLKIADAPRYPWRGLMLDVSRHFFDETTLMKVLDWMADYKLNRLHLHLTDDQGWRLEIPGYPALTQTGARGNYSETNTPPEFFTAAAMREVIAYAARRHIVVVPEIDMPGHAGAVVRSYPQLAGSTNIFNFTRAETCDFLHQVLLETMQIFPSPWIHLGGDEVALRSWTGLADTRTPAGQAGLRAAEQAEDDFINRMAGFVAAHGRTPAGWDEITTAKPAPGTVIIWWRHDKPEILARALAAGYPVVLAPRAPCYFDYPQDHSFPKSGGWKLYNTPEDVYNGPVLPQELTPDQLKHVLGVEGCLWTEHIATESHLEFMLLPRLMALAEMAWTPEDRRNFAEFDGRLKPFLRAYQKLGIKVYDDANPSASLRLAQPPSGLAQPSAAPAPEVTRASEGKL